jgi:hypothetical protein
MCRGSRSRDTAQLEVPMSRFHAIPAAVLLAALGCSSAIAGDFVPRASGSFGSAGDEGVRATCSDVGAGTAMSESDGFQSVHAMPGPAAAAATTGPTRSAKHIGVDDAATDARTAPSPADADADEKAPPPNPHKAKTLRWQSLLPGVMK